MTYRETLPTERPSRSLGTRMQLVDVPLSLQNSTGASAALSPVTDWFSYNNPSAVEKAAIDRDAYCCRMCGFVDKRFQRAVAMNGNRRDIDEMVTVCIFCNQCLHLDQVAAMESGVLIWAPEVSQAELHHIAREIYVARVMDGEIAETARACLAAILARRETAKQQIGTDDPATLSERLKVTDGLTYPDDDLSSICLFPLDRLLVHKGNRKVNLFPTILSYWVSPEGPYVNVTSDSLSWFAYGRTVFYVDSKAPTQDQSTSNGEKESEKVSTQTNSEVKEFAFRRNANDRFCFDILQLNRETNEYEHVGEYQVVDVTEAPSLSQLHVENLVYLLNGERHLIRDLGHLTNTRIEFEVQKKVNPKMDPTIIVFTAFDGNVATKHSVLELAMGFSKRQSRLSRLCKVLVLRFLCATSCSLCLVFCSEFINQETQRTHRLHREERYPDFLCKAETMAALHKKSFGRSFAPASPPDVRQGYALPSGF